DGFQPCCRERHDPRLLALLPSFLFVTILRRAPSRAQRYARAANRANAAPTTRRSTPASYGSRGDRRRARAGFLCARTRCRSVSRLTLAYSAPSATVIQVLVVPPRVRRWRRPPNCVGHLSRIALD